jgi:hypothetical protein
LIGELILVTDVNNILFSFGVLTMTFLTYDFKLLSNSYILECRCMLQESISSVQEAGSSLVPPLAPAVAAVVKDIMIRVLQITCDPEFGELDTSRHRQSLDTLPLAHTSTKLYGSETEIAECAEQISKKLHSRTASNVVCTIYMALIYIEDIVCTGCG